MNVLSSMLKFLVESIGYTGTKAQWQALMANYATVGQQAAQDAQTASTAAQTATTKADEASQSAMSGSMMCYELATPITYNLTPTEVKSLLGINNVWSDADDVDVEYRADTKLYIDKRLAEVTA